MRNKKSYLEGEKNAVKACGTAIDEMSAVISVSSHFNAEQKHWLGIELVGLMLRSSMIIEDKNKSLGVGNGE